MYIQNHATANAYGYITNTRACINNGTVPVWYRYFSENVWYGGICPVPSFCLEPCCADFIAHDTVLYFVIQNGAITRALATISNNPWTLLVLGIIALILSSVTGVIALMNLRHEHPHEHPHLTA
jgi:hypothetical protein